jgi:hypothetical protein
LPPGGDTPRQPLRPAPVTALTSDRAKTGAPGPAATVPQQASRLPMWLGLGVVVLGGAGLAAYLLIPAKTDAPGAQATAQAPAAAPTPAAVQAPSPAAPAAAPAAPTRFDAAEQFERVVAAQDRDFAVDAVPAKTQLRIGRDRLSFSVKSARDGYVQVLVLGPDGSLVLLWPNTQSANNRIKAGQTLTLPQTSWALETSEPIGAEQFLVVVSQHPRDYSALSSEREAYFLKLPTSEGATKLLAQWNRSTPMLLGSPAADCKGEGCDAYGAARFNVEVVR